MLPVPAPKLSATPGVLNINNSITSSGQHTTDILLSIGYSQTEINKLLANNVVFEEIKTKL